MTLAQFAELVQTFGRNNSAIAQVILTNDLYGISLLHYCHKTVTHYAILCDEFKEIKKDAASTKH